MERDERLYQQLLTYIKRAQETGKLVNVSDFYIMKGFTLKLRYISRNEAELNGMFEFMDLPIVSDSHIGFSFAMELLSNKPEFGYRNFKPYTALFIKPPVRPDSPPKVLDEIGKIGRQVVTPNPYGIVTRPGLDVTPAAQITIPRVFVPPPKPASPPRIQRTPIIVGPPVNITLPRPTVRTPRVANTTLETRYVDARANLPPREGTLELYYRGQGIETLEKELTRRGWTDFTHLNKGQLIDLLIQDDERLNTMLPQQVATLRPPRLPSPPRTAQTPTIPIPTQRVTIPVIPKLPPPRR